VKAVVILGEDGELAIPKKIVDKAGWKSNDKIEIEIDNLGDIWIKKK